MTNRTRTSRHRGMSLLELILALAVTTIIGTAIVGILNAISAGVDTRRDDRSVMVQANAAHSRLSAYITPSRCILDHSGDNLVLWFNDQRRSDTVHASEIRWLIFDAAGGTISMHYVKFPDAFTELHKLVHDREHPADANWSQIYQQYQSQGFIRSIELVDGLAAATCVIDDPDEPMQSRYVTYRLVFETRHGTHPVIASATIRNHRQPEA